MSILKNKYSNLYLFLYNKNYREFLRLFFKYRKIKRNEFRQIKFLNYTVEVPDCLSFIFQFKEIFVKEYYKFHSESKSPVIFDCGANIGLSVIFFKSLFPGAAIKAFEADPSIAGLLRKNLKMNSIKNVDVIAKAVWVNNGEIDFGADGADAGSIFSESNNIKVDTVRLKDLIESEKNIDLLKMDIEGAETDVIGDCGDGLKNVRNLFIEYHSFNNKEQQLDKILKILTENGFRYYIKSDEPRMHPFIRHESEISPLMDMQLNIFAYRLK